MLYRYYAIEVWLLLLVAVHSTIQISSILRIAMRLTVHDTPLLAIIVNDDIMYRVFNDYKKIMKYYMEVML